MKYIKKDGEIYHIVGRKIDFFPESKQTLDKRVDLVDPENFLQVAMLSLPKNKTFDPHVHFWVENNYQSRIAQESWVVITGRIKVTYYDKLGEILDTDELREGDISITLKGGHNYEALEHSFVYEFKSGPYEGRDKDKVLL